MISDRFVKVNYNQIDTMCCFFLFCIIMFMFMCCVYNEYNSPLLKNYKHTSLTEMLDVTDLNNNNYLSLQFANIIFLGLVCYAICKNTIKANCDSWCFNCVITSVFWFFGCGCFFGVFFVCCWTISKLTSRCFKWTLLELEVQGVSLVGLQVFLVN